MEKGDESKLTAVALNSASCLLQTAMHPKRTKLHQLMNQSINVERCRLMGRGNYLAFSLRNAKASRSRTLPPDAAAPSPSGLTRESSAWHVARSA